MNEFIINEIANNLNITDKQVSVVLSMLAEGNTVPFIDNHLNLTAESGQSLVDRVVDYLIDKMMETFFADVADVHGRALAHSLKAFEHLYGIFVVIKLLFSSQTYKPLSKTNIVFLFSVLHIICI